MKVKEAKKYIEGIEINVKHLQKLCTLPKYEKEVIAKACNIDSFDGMVNMAVNCMLSYKSVLQDKIDDADL